MELYNDVDLATFKTHIGDVVQKINDIVLNQYKPTKKEMIEVQQIILKFAKDNKRKMYGGYGLHLAITEKKPTGSFYKDDELYLKDLDLYSPEPIKDLVSLSDILHEKGFEHIYAREATHAGSYTLEVNKRPYCDFSYVPRNIYNKIPFIEVKGYIVVYPTFATIDYLKMFVDPILAASFRWEKSFDRYFALQKYYPIKLSKKELTFGKDIPQKIFDILKTFMINNNTIMVTGFQAYNTYVSISKIEKSYIRKLKFPFFEFVSTDYENDVQKILKLLQTNGDGKISIVEYYPFFTFTNFRTDIMYNGEVVVRIYENLHNLCVAYTKYDNVNYGTFHYNLRMCLINAMYERVNDDKQMEQMYYDMASHLIQMRKYYLDGTDKTMFSDTIFKDFTHECMGFTQNDKLDKDDEFKRKKRVVFKYTPGETQIDLTKWVFPNSSGNKIHNPRNYRIILKDNDVHVPIEQINEEK